MNFADLFFYLGLVCLTASGTIAARSRIEHSVYYYMHVVPALGLLAAAAYSFTRAIMVNTGSG